MSGTSDSERAHDKHWQAIVDNYGERAELDEPEPAEPTVRALADSEPTPTPSPAYHEDRFVPPTPPPLPRPEPKRAIAWAGVFGTPFIVLVALMAQVDLPTMLDYLLIGWFVGGFIYLVATMSRGPREPWDDGSRI